MYSFHPNEHLISLGTAPNPVLAHIWANALRGEGIECRVVGDFLDAGLGDISGVQPEIWIRRHDKTDAQGVLGRCTPSAVDGTTPRSAYRDPRGEQPIHAVADMPRAKIATTRAPSRDTLRSTPTRAIAFDLDPASLSSLRQALPGWKIEMLAGATEASLTDQWHPGEVDLLVVQAHDEATRTLALCRFLVRCAVFSRDSRKEVADILGPRGSLETQAQRAHVPLLVLVPAGREDLVKAALEAGAHSCLLLPIDARDVASMLVHARAGNQPGRHTQDLEGAQSEDRWRDEGGQG